MIALPPPRGRDEDPVQSTVPPPVDELARAAKKLVAIGSSVEGLAVAGRLIGMIPPNTGLAFVLVVEPGADESQLSTQLAAQTSMPVIIVNAPVAPLPDHVYVAPRGKDLTLAAQQLVPAAPRGANGDRCSVDRLLCSLAAEYGPAAVGVIVSGRGTAGAIGLKIVKESGGITIAQQPGESAPDEMSRLAVATGCVDFVLPLADIALLLTNVDAELAPSDQTAHLGDVLRELLVVLRIHTGIDFSQYRRATLFRRLARRMQVTNRASLDDYLEFARADSSELAALQRDFLISVTRFFRDPEAFAVIESEVIPRLFHSNQDDAIRIWVTGCATGEEAYSFAISLLEWREQFDPRRPIQIFATDIDDHALAEARAGRYPRAIAEDVSLDRLERFFTREGEYFQVTRQVRELVLFASHNLLRDAPFSRLDVMSCRNLLIYLERGLQEQVLRTAHFALKPDRYLFVGASESADMQDPLFDSFAARARIYVRRSDKRAMFPNASGQSSWMAPSIGPLPRLEVMHRSPGELHAHMVERYAPPSILVNGRLEVIHVSQRAARYLQFASGEPTTDLFQTVLPELRLELRAAVYAARRTPGSSVSSTTRLEIGGRPRDIRMGVEVESGTEPLHGNMLVWFEETDVAPTRSAPDANAAGQPAIEPVVRQLEDELRRTRDELRTTVEQYEALVEELHSSNEEQQAVNEELRSAGEEIEAAREETDSINQELTTVNQELKLRIEETSAAKSDIANLMESSDVGVIFVNRELRIFRFTQRAREIFNVIETDVGRPLSDLTSNIDYEELGSDACAVLETLSPIEREVRHVDENRSYLVRMRPYRSLEDRIAGIAMTFIDITALRRTEDALRQKEAMLELADRRKNEFIATLAHELRNPLTPLAMALDLQRLCAHDADRIAQTRATMERQVAQLRRLVDDLLDISRIQTGRLELRIESAIALAEVIAHACEAVRPLIEEQHQRIDSKVAAELRIDGDRGRLEQVFTNLLMNAAKYSNAGGVISVEATPGPETVIVTVTDAGVGIAADVLPRIFDLFVQAEPLRTRTRGGLGIGLTLVKELVVRHGGTITAESAGLGTGSRFSVVLPVREPQVVP